MTIQNCENNKDLKIIAINIEDEKLKLRLCEIGFFNGAIIKVLNKSWLKQTLLVGVLDSCFAIKSEMAKMIEVEYV